MNQRSVDVAARCIAPAVKVTQGHTGYLDLDLVPPVHLCTSGSSLSPFQPVLCRVFNFLPCDPNPFQVLLKMSYAMSSLGVLFFVRHLLESTLLLL